MLSFYSAEYKEPILIAYENSNESVSMVSGRFQKLYAAGLLRESIVAEGLLRELRMSVRECGDLIEMGST